MFKIIQDTPFAKEFEQALTKENSLLIDEVNPTIKAFCLASYQKHCQKDILIVIGDESKNDCLENLKLFSDSPRVVLPESDLGFENIAMQSMDTQGERMQTLLELGNKHVPSFVFVSIKSLLQKVAPAQKIDQNFLHIRKGEKIALSEMKALLEDLGYEQHSIVSDKGQFALRGGIVDVFSLSEKAPYRMEFFDEVIEEIRIFDPLGQRSMEKILEATISPKESFEKIEEKVSLLEYFPDSPIVFEDLLLVENHFASTKETMDRFSSQFISINEVFSRKNLFFSDQSIEELSQSVSKENEHLSFEMFSHQIQAKRLSHHFLEVSNFLDTENIKEGLSQINKNLSVIVVTEREKEQKLLESYLPEGINKTHISGYLSHGLGWHQPDTLVIPFTEITKVRKLRRHKTRISTHAEIHTFPTLEVGDLVVHFHNGIGKYVGLEVQKNLQGESEEFLVLEYAEQSKLYVPISQSHLISPYTTAEQEKPYLHKLGTNQWQKTKAKAEKAIVGYANDLLQIEAMRQIKGGFSFPDDTKDIEDFTNSFPYDETEDQLRAIFDVKKDMESPVAMDRLICGDVGYGKTEVAMRACIKAVLGGKKQVAVLVPTTILAMQHYENFCERMMLFPIKICLLSRFQKKKELSQNLKDIAEGTVDIIIGTHRLISKDVSFHDLGLLVIDEEQRFGVRAKEHLRKIKVGVDCLTMSATPIPRTLYFSLIGARTMSPIHTPPSDRIPVKTIIAEKDSMLIKNAILREISRNGQGYYLHNRVETIYKTAKDLQKLVPQLRVGVTHGQMHPDELEEVFHAFKRGEIDFLVTTTLVENGIDIPNANTILIERADRFGISDLYQLRGRVGRWDRPSFAYFLLPPNRVVSEIAQKRMQALVDSSGFGGGMRLALKDLEIRGAGDILGDEQSGHMATIGFHLYCKLLKKAVYALKMREQINFTETKIDHAFFAKIPPVYIPDAKLRLELYHRIGNALATEELQNIYDECRDRFGSPPKPFLWLYHLARVRLFAQESGFTSLSYKKLMLVAEKSDQTRSFLLKETQDPEKLEKESIEKLTSF